MTNDQDHPRYINIAEALAFQDELWEREKQEDARRRKLEDEEEVSYQYIGLHPRVESMVIRDHEQAIMHAKFYWNEEPGE